MFLLLFVIVDLSFVRASVCSFVIRCSSSVDACSLFIVAVVVLVTIVNVVVVAFVFVVVVVNAMLDINVSGK